MPGIKGEIDLIGYDGRALAFVEVKTRSSAQAQSTPEDAVNADKRRNPSRMARQFLRSRRIDSASCRFDVLAIESHAGKIQSCACTNPPSVWRSSHSTNTADSEASGAGENGTPFALTSLGS